MKLSSSTKLCVLFATAVAVAVASLPCADAAAEHERELKKTKTKCQKKEKKTKKTKKPKTDSPTTVSTVAPTVESVAQRLSKLKNVVAFGDSLTDIGNVEPFFPCAFVQLDERIYCGPRASNGPLFVEYLTELLGLPAMSKALKPSDADPSQPTLSGGTNFAITGDTARDRDGSGFVTQLGLYTQYVKFFGSEKISPETLHFISFGGNDVVLASPENKVAEIQKSVADYIRNIKSLIAIGACSFLILGPTDIGRIPYLPKAFSATATNLSIRFNTELQEALKDVTIENTDPLCLGIEHIDFFGAFNTLDSNEEVSSEFPEKNIACNERFIQDCDYCAAVLDPFGQGPYAEFEDKCNCGLPVSTVNVTLHECDGGVSNRSFIRACVPDFTIDYYYYFFLTIGIYFEFPSSSYCCSCPFFLSSLFYNIIIAGNCQG